jgi:hypothetical protein
MIRLPPPPPSPVSKLNPETHRKTEKERQLADEGVGGGGIGAESDDRKKAWPSINHSILSGQFSPCYPFKRAMTTFALFSSLGDQQEEIHKNVSTGKAEIYLLKNCLF